MQLNPAVDFDFNKNLIRVRLSPLSGHITVTFGIFKKGLFGTLESISDFQNRIVFDNLWQILPNIHLLHDDHEDLFIGLQEVEVNKNRLIGINAGNVIPKLKLWNSIIKRVHYG